MTAQRILICLHDLHRGGTERIALGLAANWREAGRNVTLLCGSLDGGLREMLDGRVKVEQLDPPVRRGLFSRLWLGRAMGRRVPALKPDVIFLPGNFHAPLAGALRAADPRPVIALKISNPPLPHGLPFAGAIFRHVTRAVDGFAAMNSGLARELEAMLPGRNIVTLHDPAYIRARKRKTMRQGGIGYLQGDHRTGIGPAQGIGQHGVKIAGQENHIRLQGGQALAHGPP